MFFVAEIGSNWVGDTGKAAQLIEECYMAGANAVKFQMWRADDLYNGKYKEYELTFDKAIQIKKYCDHIGIEFFCSVFYPEAVEFLEKLGVKRYKLATRTMVGIDPHSADTILAVRKTGKPIIYSNGKLYPDPNYDKLYCIPKYPTNPDDIDWHKILYYDGFSDHTLGIEAALKFYKLRPNAILEKHVKLEDNDSPDSAFSITIPELSKLIQSCKTPHHSKGNKHNHS